MVGGPGSAPAGEGQHLKPRVAGSNLQSHHCGDRGARAGSELGGASGEVELPVRIVAAEEQHRRRVQRAEDATDDGCGGPPRAELLPFAHAGPVGLVDALGDDAFDTGGGVVAFDVAAPFRRQHPYRLGLLASLLGWATSARPVRSAALSTRTGSSRSALLHPHFPDDPLPGRSVIRLDQAQNIRGGGAPVTRDGRCRSRAPAVVEKQAWLRLT
jgi:hypothetical protein